MSLKPQPHIPSCCIAVDILEALMRICRCKPSNVTNAGNQLSTLKQSYSSPPVKPEHTVILLTRLLTTITHHTSPQLKRSLSHLSSTLQTTCSGAGLGDVLLDALAVLSTDVDPETAGVARGVVRGGRGRVTKGLGGVGGLKRGEVRARSYRLQTEGRRITTASHKRTTKHTPSELL